jgi:hypothetical protein
MSTRYTETAARRDYNSPNEYNFNRLRKGDMIFNLIK